MSDERRSAKLHKQTEVEVDDAGEDASRVTEAGPAVETSSTTCAGIPSPTVQSASSSSGTSPDESPPKVVVPPPITRKPTLIRGVALEGTSPPPESFFSQIPPNGTVQDSRQLPNGASGTSTEKNGKKKGQSHEAKEFLLASNKISNDSGHGTMDHNDGASDTSVLSRDSSLENASVKDVYKDSSGVNIPKFMRDTLLKSAKDRKTILSYEDQLLNFVSDSAQTHKMPEMTSYDRMIVHRLAAFLGLEHNVDSTGKCVILNRTENTRSVKLSDIILFEDAEQEPKKKILLKKPASLDEKHSRGSNKAQFGAHRAKSLEERQQSYMEARERIFNQNDENMLEGSPGDPNLLTANYIPGMYQRTQDTRSCGQLSTKWFSPESGEYSGDCISLNGARLRASMTKTNSFGGTTSASSASNLSLSARRTLSLNKAESLKDSPDSPFLSPPHHLAACQLPGPIVTPIEHSHISRSTPDAGQSPVTHSQPCPQLAYLVSSDYSSIPIGSLIINPMTMQPHVNADGSLYRFDPTCPPPFMVQPPAQPPPAHIIYQSDSIPDVAARFAATSIGSVDQGSEHYATGMPAQAIPVVSAMVPHIQSMYTSPHPSQFTQSQYFTTASPTAGQQPVRYVAIPYQGQGQQLLQATPVDGHGQTTVPMPAVGIPAIASAGGSYQLMSSPYQQPITGGNPSHCVDFNPTAYHYGAVSEPVMVGRTTGLNTSANVASGAAQHVVLTYPQPQPQQHAMVPSHQTQFMPTATAPQGTFYTVPVSSPTPPLTLTQPPPSSHLQQQQHQPTVYYPSNIGNPLTYPVMPSNPSSSSSSSTTLSKSVSTPFIQTQYRPSTPPQQQLQHHPQQPQSSVISSNGHHPSQLTLNYSHPVPFSPAQPLGPSQGSQLVTFQPNAYHVRPVGAAVIQLAGSPVVQTPQAGTSPQVQSYQLIRPAGSLSDVRMINPGPGRPSLSTVQLSNPSTQQQRLKSISQGRQPKKGGKKSSGCQDTDDYQPDLQGASSPQQTGHVSVMIPLSLPGPIPQTHPHHPSASSNRQ